MKNGILGACAAVMVGMVIVAPANAAGIGIEANVAHTEDRTGGEFGIGYGFSLGRFDLTPAVGAFIYKGDDNGYFETTDRNNVTRCRAPNGRFAKDSECNNIAVKAYARAEVGVTVSQVRLGGGIRYMEADFGSDFRPYGTVSYSFSPQVAIKGNVGDDYYAAGLSLGF